MPLRYGRRQGRGRSRLRSWQSLRCRLTGGRAVRTRSSGCRTLGRCATGRRRSACWRASASRSGCAASAASTAPTARLGENGARETEGEARCQKNKDWSLIVHAKPPRRNRAVRFLDAQQTGRTMGSMVRSKASGSARSSQTRPPDRSGRR